ncbi:MAG: LysR family transcriptional regulator [Notoacmeibacter sp.]|nr:LysR family transcriptional regulator [Notoacmeibacter sp.]MCC0033353.1 LysR family transcriptional regulator [Brucellaceae bacterium]
MRAASKRLGKTQPALTQALRKAESELGAAIFKRSPNGVTATEEGRIILQRAGRIQAELIKMQEDVDQRIGSGTGRLNVTVSPLAANRIIPATIKRFRRRYPCVQVQISGGHEPMAFAPVRDGAVDIVIGPEPKPADAIGLAVERLIETPVVIITGLGSRWTGAKTLGDLAAGDWLLIGTPSRVASLQQHFIQRGLLPPTPVVTSDSIQSILSLLQDSDFLCTFPGLLLEQTLANWRIRSIEIDEPLLPAQISTITSSERPPTPAQLHFCDCVRHVAYSELAGR